MGDAAEGTQAWNEPGSHDMSGNVYEWCWDLRGFYYADERVGPSHGFRVVRGANSVECEYGEHAVFEERETGPCSILSGPQESAFRFPTTAYDLRGLRRGPGLRTFHRAISACQMVVAR